MQTLSKALIDLVVSGDVDEETAAAAAPNRHDFMIALGRALKEHAVQAGGETVESPEPDEATDAEDRHSLRVDGLRIT
jgi:hypothetical protein